MLVAKEIFSWIQTMLSGVDVKSGEFVMQKIEGKDSKKNKDQSAVSVQVSFMEIYNESVNDLLSDQQSGKG